MADVVRSIVIGTAPRRGSTLLTAAMRSTGAWGDPQGSLAPGEEAKWADEGGIGSRAR